jgi:hypothetical protein
MGFMNFWPDGLPTGAFRFARRTNHFAESVAFYRDLVGLPLLMTFEPHEPDGREVIFAPWIFGKDTTPAQVKGLW